MTKTICCPELIIRAKRGTYGRSGLCERRPRFTRWKATLRDAGIDGPSIMWYNDRHERGERGYKNGTSVIVPVDKPLVSSFSTGKLKGGLRTFCRGPVNSALQRAGTGVGEDLVALAKAHDGYMRDSDFGSEELRVLDPSTGAMLVRTPTIMEILDLMGLRNYKLPSDTTISELMELLGEMHTMDAVIEFYRHMAPAINAALARRPAPSGQEVPRGAIVDMRSQRGAPRPDAAKKRKRAQLKRKKAVGSEECERRRSPRSGPRRSPRVGNVSE